MSDASARKSNHEASKIDPTGTFLVASGEKSCQLSVYGIDADSGELSLLSRCAGGRGANWIEIVEQREITKPATCGGAAIAQRFEELTHRRLIPINMNPNFFLYHHVHNF
jgi:hypothetical protein